MNKLARTCPATVFCGIDVSARSLSVALIGQDHSNCQREFANSASGHKALLREEGGCGERSMSAQDSDKHPWEAKHAAEKLGIWVELAAIARPRLKPAFNMVALCGG